MPRPSSRAAAPEYSYMREQRTTYQQACKLIDESLDDIRAAFPYLLADERASLIVARGKLRKVQRYLTEGR